MTIYWRVISIVLIGWSVTACAARADRSPIDNLKNVGLLILIVVAIIAVIVVVYRVTKGLAIVGVLVGLILGAAIILSVPIELQYAVVGGIFGIGGDFAASKAKGTPSTMIEALSSFIVKTTKAANEVASETDLEHEKRRASQLLWSAVGTVALMLIVGRIWAHAA